MARYLRYQDDACVFEQKVEGEGGGFFESVGIEPFTSSGELPSQLRRGSMTMTAEFS
jgi:hypothetical protein